MIDLTKLRNIGIIAHIDAGKTTTSEHLLYYAGVKHKLGAVDSGNTETDYDPEEQERGITIYSACIPFTWKGYTINLIDTPGHVDFTAEVERSLRVLDGAICVFDAQKGVEAQSETVWRQANKYGVPRLVFINKMDVVGANFEKAVGEVRERLEGNPVPISIPMGAGSSKDSHDPFKGIIDLLQMKALYFEAAELGKSMREAEIPAEYLEDAKKYREQMFDALTAHDEKDLITSAVLESHDADLNKIRELIRELTIKGTIHPVMCGSGREHIGIQPLLDGICFYLPSPLDRPPVAGTNPKKDGKEEKRKPDPKEPFAGLVFKFIGSDHGGLFFIRIYSGTLKPNSRVLNPGRDSKEVIGKIFHVHADPKAEREDLPEAYAGDIVATIGLKEAVTGDTLCETQHPILLEKIVFAEAVVSQSIEPDSNADKDKMIECLKMLEREDPTFICQLNKETGQLTMSGMGTLHLEVKRHRLERDFRLKVRVRPPRVSYRETIRNNKTVTGECVRQAGASQLFAKLTVSFESRVGKEPTGITNKLKPNDLPAPLMAAAERGLKSALQSGELGFPLLNVHGTIISAQMDQETSNEVAFEAAAADAVARALKDNIILMEPIMKLNVTVPDEFMGNVIGDLMSRRAEIDRQDSNGRISIIDARVPLAKMFDYADKVRSLTQGRAGSTMEPFSYAAAPDEVLRSFIDPEY
ncbi:elongation factor G [Telmatocola sphagniphila]|uniref:elongation factor G n=1 Tax=Telmatocola sphagniphila TaxID=1123043 RepID=UPI001FEA3F62|nr:elongation factor G [Telmatocola sphagniphila]